MHYAMGLAVSVVIAGVDRMRIPGQAFEVAARAWNPSRNNRHRTAAKSDRIKELVEA